ncbi:MAG TPA: HAD family phosphatase [Chromatiaceae bacterium]|nr:HAD family phosphatase [Chromatiaceae bacterium]
MHIVHSALNVTVMERKEKSITTVLFDYGGVIAEEGFRAGLAVIALRFGLDPAELLHQATDAIYDSGYVVGRGTEAGFWKLLQARTGIRAEHSALTREIIERFVLRTWMIEWVEHLKQQGYRTGLLSDQTDWLERLDHRDHFLNHFDSVFNSYHLGLGKRSPRLFRMVACRLGERAEHILFIDDAPGNLQRARSVKMQTLLFQDRNQFEEELQRLLNVSAPSGAASAPGC